MLFSCRSTAGDGKVVAVICQPLHPASGGGREHPAGITCVSQVCSERLCLLLICTALRSSLFLHGDGVSPVPRCLGLSSITAPVMDECVNHRGEHLVPAALPAARSEHLNWWVCLYPQLLPGALLQYSGSRGGIELGCVSWRMMGLCRWPHYSDQP